MAATLKGRETMRLDEVRTEADVTKYCADYLRRLFSGQSIEFLEHLFVLGSQHFILLFMVYLMLYLVTWPTDDSETTALHKSNIVPYAGALLVAIPGIPLSMYYILYRAGRNPSWQALHRMITSKPATITAVISAAMSVLGCIIIDAYYFFTWKEWTAHWLWPFVFFCTFFGLYMTLVCYAYFHVLVKKSRDGESDGNGAYTSIPVVTTESTAAESSYNDIVRS